jgi:hypothetical protein
LLDLGTLLPNTSGLLDMDFNLTVTERDPGDGFAVALALATVPEQPSWPYFLVGTFRLLAYRAFRQRT